MGETTIEWTERTWNPVAGCSLESPGCTNCYAMKMAHRLARMGQKKYAGLTKMVNGKPVWTGELRVWAPDIEQPLKVKKPSMWFVNSMSDLFHPSLSYDDIERVFDVMLQTEHRFQILTKRPNAMKAFVERFLSPALLPTILENIWLGISVEDRKRKDRIDVLRTVPAMVRFLSIEPQLEDLGDLDLTGIHWVIIGGESGLGARPFSVQWARSIIAQCKEQNVPVFMKQLGSQPTNAEHSYGKGGDMSEWPEDLRVREFPL